MSQPQTQTQTQKGPLFAYRSFIETGELHEDSAQGYAAEKLQSLWDRL
ncbi:MAG: cell division protein ZapE, partial [Alphaproteobacteria bacterium]|nr:cell division protein ZapE [Alphaproteobacteria bacterium]